MSDPLPPMAWCSRCRQMATLTHQHCPRCRERVYLVQDARGIRFYVDHSGRRYC